jgi:hypothetical protein
MSQYFMIEYRKKTLAATHNSQRRCYHGHFHEDDWEEGWTAWTWLNLKLTLDQATQRLEFWENLNQYCVDARGERARKEFRVVPDTVYDGSW